MQPIKGQPEKDRSEKSGSRSGMSMAELREKWTGRGGAPTGGGKKGGGKKPRSGSRPGGPRLLVGGLGLAALVVGWLISTRILLPAPPEPGDLIAVPALDGDDLATVQSALADVGLTLAGVDSVGHSVVPAGIVFGQTPLAGQLATRGGEVQVTISMGAERVAVPNVKGSPLAEARQLLASAGFTVAVDTIDSSRPSGEVISQTPTAGQRVALPLDVELTVSEGPPTVPMPDLVGLDEQDAIAVLDSIGLELTVIDEQFRFGQDMGRVLEQDPPAGEITELGSPVRLVVGRRRR